MVCERCRLRELPDPWRCCHRTPQQMISGSDDHPPLRPSPCILIATFPPPGKSRLLCIVTASIRLFPPRSSSSHTGIRIAPARSAARQYLEDMCSIRRGEAMPCSQRSSHYSVWVLPTAGTGRIHLRPRRSCWPRRVRWRRGRTHANRRRRRMTPPAATGAMWRSSPPSRTWSRAIRTG